MTDIITNQSEPTMAPLWSTPMPPPWPGPNPASNPAPVAGPAGPAPVVPGPARRSRSTPAVVALVVVVLLAVIGVGVGFTMSQDRDLARNLAASSLHDSVTTPAPTVPDVTVPDMTLDTTIPPLTASPSAGSSGIAMSDDLIFKGMDLGWDAVPADDRNMVCSLERSNPELAAEGFLMGMRKSVPELPAGVTSEKVGQWLQGKCAAA